MDTLTCFNACDIRGVLGVDLNEDIARRIGLAYGTHLKPKRVIVGGDIRISSESIKMALSEGLREAGVDVFDIGLVGSEEVYFSTFHLGMDGGVEVTASHNPIEFNRMKLVQRNARPISRNSGLKDIQFLAEKNEFMKIRNECERGKYQRINTRDKYIDHLLSYVNVSNFKSLKIVINSGNGAAGSIIDAIEKRFHLLNVPVTIIKINNTPDGTFPNGIPNPLLPECRKDTHDAVLLNNADMGIAFDGDFDRCFLFDHNGKFIEGYYVVGLLAEALLEKNPGESVIHDSRLFWNTIEIAERAGGKALLSPTGHAFIKENMLKHDAIYGGEVSGHHYFREFSYCDSGMIPWLLIIELICKKGLSLDEMVKNNMAAFPASEELNFKLSQPKIAVDLVRNYFSLSGFKIDYSDGITVTGTDWRFNLRSSNTEPLVRLNVESRGSNELVNKIVLKVTTLLSPHMLY